MKTPSQKVIIIDTPDDDAIEVPVTTDDLQVENSLFNSEKETSFNLFGMTSTRSITSGRRVVITGKITGREIGCRITYSESEDLGAQIKSNGPISCLEDVYLDETGTYVLETTVLPLGLNRVEVFTRKEKAIFNITVIDIGAPNLIELADISLAGNTDLETIDDNHYRFKKKIRINSPQELELIASIKNAYLGEQFYVHSIWRSLITSSTILTDKGTEIIVIKPPNVIEEGEHVIYVKTVNPDAFISSDVVRIDYNLKYKNSLPIGPLIGLLLLMCLLVVTIRRRRGYLSTRNKSMPKSSS